MKDYNPSKTSHKVETTSGPAKKPLKIRFFKAIRILVTLGTFGFIIFCFSFLPAYLRKPVNPGHIEITGHKILPMNSILSILSIDKNAKWIDLDPYELTQKLDSQPWIEHAIVHRTTDLGINIAIKEVVPILFIKSKNKIYMLNDKHMVLSLVQSGEGWKLPVVVNNNINDLEPGKPIPEKYLYKAVELINLLSKSVVLPLNAVSEIDVSDPLNIQLITIPKAVLIKLGSTNFKEKLNNLKLVIPALKEEEDNLRYIDLRYKNAVVFRRKV